MSAMTQALREKIAQEIYVCQPVMAKVYTVPGGYPMTSMVPWVDLREDEKSLQYMMADRVIALLDRVTVLYAVGGTDENKAG